MARNVVIGKNKKADISFKKKKIKLGDLKPYKNNAKIAAIILTLFIHQQLYECFII